MTPTIRVLLTEDVGADAELEVRELKRAGLRVAHKVVDTEDSFKDALREFAPDVILSDFSMPHFDGMSALAIAREVAPDTPFIFVSGTIGEEYAIRALKNGATDYVVKTNLVRLPAAVERALADAKDRREKRRTEAELEIARERLTSIFTSLPDMLWSVDAPGDEILYLSPAATEIFGHTPDEFIADDGLWIDVVHPEDRPAVNAAWERMMHGGASFDVEYRVVRPDGSIRWVNDRGRVIRNAAGAAERIDGLARDITEQVEHRRRIARMQRIRDLISRVNAAIVRVRERYDLFEEFCRIAVETGGFASARLIERDRHSGLFRVATAKDGGDAVLQRLVDTINATPGRAHGLLPEALRSGRIAASNDVSADSRVALRDAYDRDDVNSLACVPYHVEGAVDGAIVLKSRERGVFDDEEIRLLGELGGNLGFALELIAKQDRISYLALYDTLTGLPNRALFHERLVQAIEGARRAGMPLALAIIDLERFKAINDTFGQHVGDRVLKVFATKLQETAGGIERLARLGGNLYAVTFSEAESVAEVARRIEQKTASVVGEPIEVEGREMRLAAKAGIAVFPEDGGDADALFRNAEAALKRAKETGERYLFYAPDINARVAEQVELESRLRKAVDNGELYLHFQPKLEMVTRRLVGFEALMRWSGADGPVSPGKFVPVLEQTGLILEAGRQAIARASTAYRDWQARGLNPPRIAVNVSALQLRRASFVEDVLSALGEGGAQGCGVDLEITESLLMTDVDESIRKLRALREQGLNIALDDFGTGYSSLAYLSRLPLDTLKIDRAFVHGMTANADDTSIVSTIISLAQSLRLKVVAEGVETEEQAQLLRQLCCDQVQGYFFGKPMSLEDAEALIRGA